MFFHIRAEMLVGFIKIVKYISERRVDDSKHVVIIVWKVWPANPIFVF